MKTIKTRWLLLCLAASGMLTGSLLAAEKSLTVDKAKSNVEISVKATADSFVGKLADYSPTLTLDPATGKVTAAKIAFHFNDVKTGNEKRDREMHVWQQTEKFPDGDFTLETLEPSTDGKLVAHGTLTFHGMAHVLEFSVKIAQAESGVTVDGEAMVDTRLYGLPVIHKFAVLKVDPVVGIHFHLVGTVSSP
jgi:polyisoprenoid-binding protein YceI